MNKTVFVVDDNDTNLTACKFALQKTYRVFTFPSAQKMFGFLEKIIPDIILLDVNMPDIDGYTAIKTLQANEKFKDIPVIFLTAFGDETAEVRCFELGAVDFIAKPFNESVLLRRLQTHLNVDEIVRSRTKAIQNLQNGILEVVADMVENRDDVTGGHIARTTQYLRILLEGMKESSCYYDEISRWDMKLILPSAQLHDVGKIVISDVILNKPGKLTDEEFEKMKTHASEGERIINLMMEKTKEEGFLIHAKMFAAYHHEKWNGKGYPYGLAGTQIPLQGRIMAVADVYDALVSKRPYKEPFSHEKAVEIIMGDSGIHFDPLIASEFLKVEKKIEEASKQLQN